METESTFSKDLMEEFLVVGWLMIPLETELFVWAHGIILVVGSSLTVLVQCQALLQIQPQPHSQQHQADRQLQAAALVQSSGHRRMVTTQVPVLKMITKETWKRLLLALVGSLIVSRPKLIPREIREWVEAVDKNTL